MGIILIDHTVERASQRGATEEEIKKVVSEGVEIQAKRGRKAKERVFNYNNEWLGKFYPQKKIVAVYNEEDDNIVVITVKVYYGEWR